ncbi:MAG: RidA family protein [Acidobacteriota bacterium]|nr:RidA family protein [Acidobacteriota bacterium]
MDQKVVDTPDAPAAIGPYVQGRMVGPFLFSSGQIGMDPKSGEVVAGGIEAQTRLALSNLAAVVRQAGGDLSNIVKTTVFVKDIGHFGRINEIYADFFGGHKPARSLVEAARLPKDALIEIECIAHIG